MKATTIILSQGLPKTGQFTECQQGDDGTYEAGWLQGLSFANNKQRFIAQTIDGDDVVVDLSTGLMWAADGNKEGCNNGNDLVWNNAIDYATALEFAGFNDWRLPNIFELFSIINFAASDPAVYITFFPNTKSDYYWSSTSYLGSATVKFVVNFNIGVSQQRLHEALDCIRCVRGGI